MKRTAAAAALVVALVACGGGSRDGAGRTVIQNKGSDTLVTVAQAWAEAYRDIDPNVAVAVTGGGSGTGIAALINGTADLANASRKIKEEEFAQAEANGVTPVEHVVGFDALAVFLHVDNPLDAVTLAQLAEIYGEGGTFETWSQVGVAVPGCGSDEVVRVSRQNNSGTYVYFQESVLGTMRDYKLGSRDMHGSKDVVDLVANTPCAIGYSGLAYATHEVKMPCVMEEAGGECIVPSSRTAADRTYPIARPLMMYTAGAPAGATAEYLEWILSDEGQCIIAQKGYAPLRDLSCDPPAAAEAAE